MRRRNTQRCHYLNEENVPLSVAIREAIADYDRSRPAAECPSINEYLDVELVDTLFTESIVNEEGVSLSLQVTLPDRRVDVHTARAYTDEPVRIDVTKTVE